MPGTADALDRAPLVAPATRGWGRATSLWRLRAYLRPRLGRFWTMAALDGYDIVTMLAIPLLTRAAIDGPLAAGDRAGVIRYGVLALVIGISAAGAGFIRRWLSSEVTLATETSVRLDLYARLQRLPMAFHDRWQSGQLLSRMMNDLSVMRRFTSFGLLMLLASLLQIAITVVLLIRLYWPLGVVVLLGVGPVIWLCLRMERDYTKLSRRIQDQTGDAASVVQESVHGLRTLRAFGRQRWAYQRFDSAASTLYDTQLSRVRLISRFFTLLDVIPSVVAIIVLGIGAYAAANGTITLGTLVAFMTLLLSLVWPVTALGFLLSMTQDAMTAADRVCEVLDSRSDIVSGEVRLPRAGGALSFENAGFRFPDSDVDVLHGLDLRIAPGETIAIVGGTGSGKTTLTQLIARLRDVTSGRITLDGIDLRELDLDDLRGQVATAFSDATLFSMSARENLTLGRADATDEEIAEAIEVAQAHFVHDLPWGLDTRIGEQGMSLSGGQRQRLALARAVLVRPSVLVLDDTLSALDIHTEALVETALARVLGNSTAIIVAHRASTVLLADRVAMLVDGTITAVGTHTELLANDPRYRELMSADFDCEQEFDELEDEEAAS